MEHLPFQAKGIFGRSIDGISQKGMVDIGHVDPNLMGTPRLQPRFNPRKGSKALQNPIMGNRSFGIFLCYRLLQPVLRISANRRVYSTCLIRKVIIYNGLIDSGNTMFC